MRSLVTAVWVGGMCVASFCIVVTRCSAQAQNKKIVADHAWVTPGPEYPDELHISSARNDGVIQVSTTRSGSIGAAAIIKTAGDPILDRHAIQFAKAHWHGPPQITVQLPIRFRLGAVPIVVKFQLSKGGLPLLKAYVKLIEDAVGGAWFAAMKGSGDAIPKGLVRASFTVAANGEIDALRVVPVQDSNALLAELTLKALKQTKIPAMPDALAQSLENGHIEFPAFDFGQL